MKVKIFYDNIIEVVDSGFDGFVDLFIVLLRVLYIMLRIVYVIMSSPLWIIGLIFNVVVKMFRTGEK